MSLLPLFGKHLLTQQQREREREREMESERGCACFLLTKGIIPSPYSLESFSKILMHCKFIFSDELFPPNHKKNIHKCDDRNTLKLGLIVPLTKNYFNFFTKRLLVIVIQIQNYR